LFVFSVGSISRSEFVFHDRLRMQQPAWRVAVSSCVLPRTCGDGDWQTRRCRNETKLICLSAFTVFKLKKSWLFSRISNLCVGRGGRTRRKICSRSNIRKTFLDTFMLKELVTCWRLGWWSQTSMTTMWRISYERIFFVWWLDYEPSSLTSCFFFFGFFIICFIIYVLGFEKDILCGMALALVLLPSLLLCAAFATATLLERWLSW